METKKTTADYMLLLAVIILAAYATYTTMQNFLIDKETESLWMENEQLKESNKQLIFQSEQRIELDLGHCLLQVKGLEDRSFFLATENITEPSGKRCTLLKNSCNNNTRYGTNCTWLGDMDTCKCYSPSIKS